MEPTFEIEWEEFDQEEPEGEDFYEEPVEEKKKEKEKDKGMNKLFKKLGIEAEKQENQVEYEIEQ